MSPRTDTDGMTCRDLSPRIDTDASFVNDIVFRVRDPIPKLLGLGQGIVSLFTATHSNYTLHAVWGEWISTGHTVSICPRDTKMSRVMQPKPKTFDPAVYS